MAHLASVDHAHLFTSGDEVFIPCQIAVCFMPDYPALFYQTDFPVFTLPVFDLCYRFCPGYITPQLHYIRHRLLFVSDNKDYCCTSDSARQLRLDSLHEP